MDHLAFLLLVASAASAQSNSASEPWLDWSLPKSLSPFQYDLSMQPDVWKREFDGNVSIHMSVLAQTKFIIVHTARMNVSSVQVFVNKTTEMNIVRSFAYEQNDYFVVETEQQLLMGSTVKVNMKFNGFLQFLTGVISQGYTSAKTGKHSPLIVTTFKPNYARFAFPCFDEPYFKSRFTITIRHWVNSSSVSNMPSDRVRNIDSDWMDTTFKRTPEISSFAASFVVSNYDFRNNTLPDGKPHRIWARSDRVDQVGYALNVTSTIQGYLQSELGNIESLEKIDQFDVPLTFYGGGQHHFGLILHSDHRLTFHSTRDQDIKDQHNLVLLATGLTSNYFGNIVSCRSWNHVWLDSALADFYAWKAAATIDESVSFYEQQRKEQALIYDSINKSRPVVMSLTTNTTRAEDVYHPLTVVKGVALLKMLEDVLTPKKFKRGIKKYLRTYKRKTVVTEDLWSVLQMQAGADTNISEMMNSWVYSMGYPVINIQLLPDNKLNITQKRFMMDPLDDLESPTSAYGYKWHVPINYKTESGRADRIWLNKTNSVDVIHLNASDNWFLFNYNQAGYFRVNYDVALWENITKQLLNDYKVFTDQQRSQLLSDALNVAEAQQLGFDTALSLTQYASKERYLPAWINIYDALGKIHVMLSNKSYLERFQKYVLNLTTELMNELEVKDEGTPEQKILRGTIIPMSCSSGHQSCRANTTRLYKAWIENDTLNAIPVNIRRTVYCNGIAHSDDEFEWNTTFSRFLAQDKSQAKEDLLIGMACVRNLTLLERFLESFLSNDTIGHVWFGELEKAIAELRMNPTISAYLWDWFKANYDRIDDRYSFGTGMWLTGPVTRNFNTEKQLKDVRDFFALTSNITFFETIKIQTEKTISANIRFVEKNYVSVSRWFEENVPI